MSLRGRFLGFCATALCYGVAVSVATTVTLFLVAVPAVLPDDGRWRSVYDILRYWPDNFAFGWMITAFTAFPGFLYVLYLSRKHAWTKAMNFVVAGALNVVPSLVIFHVFLGAVKFMSPVMLLSCFPGGLAGGHAYWLAARMLRLYPRGSSSLA